MSLGLKKSPCLFTPIRVEPRGKNHLLSRVSVSPSPLALAIDIYSCGRTKQDMAARVWAPPLPVACAVRLHLPPSHDSLRTSSTTHSIHPPKSSVAVHSILSQGKAWRLWFKLYPLLHVLLQSLLLLFTGHLFFSSSLQSATMDPRVWTPPVAALSHIHQLPHSLSRRLHILLPNQPSRSWSLATGSTPPPLFYVSFRSVWCLWIVWWSGGSCHNWCSFYCSMFFLRCNPVNLFPSLVSCSDGLLLFL